MHSLADDPSVVQRILDHIDNRTTDRGAGCWREPVENYRSELVWKTMRSNPHIVRGLTRAGFAGGWLAGK